MAQSSYRIAMVGTKEVKLSALKILARKLGRHPTSIITWEKKKKIPKPVFNLGDTFRWYTEEEMDMYHMLMEQEGIKNGSAFNKTKFTPRAFAEIKLIGRKYETIRIQNQ